MLTEAAAPHASNGAALHPGSGGGAPSAWERAHHFVDYLARLSTDEWDEVLQRVRAVDATAHAAALRRMADVLDGRDARRHLRAIEALQRAACAAPPPFTGASRLAAHAALALALRDALDARDFAALYGPFARPEPHAAGDAPQRADRRVVVDALADVARPLGDV